MNLVIRKIPMIGIGIKFGQWYFSLRRKIYIHLGSISISFFSCKIKSQIYEKREKSMKSVNLYRIQLPSYRNHCRDNIHKAI